MLLLSGVGTNALGYDLAPGAPTEVLSPGAKDAAVRIERRLQFGSKLFEVVKSREDAIALFNLYKNEGYILTEHEGEYCVVLKESALPQDMLKSMFHVNYLYWLETNAGIKPSSAADDCRPGGRLQMSLELSGTSKGTSRAYDKAVIKCNGREAVTNFEPNTYEGDKSSAIENGVCYPSREICSDNDEHWSYIFDRISIVSSRGLGESSCW